MLRTVLVQNGSNRKVCPQSNRLCGQTLIQSEIKAVVLSMEDYKKLNKPEKPTLFEFFQNSPWHDVELELPERRERKRGMNHFTSLRVRSWGYVVY
jgi:hypothetical protein